MGVPIRIFRLALVACILALGFGSTALGGVDSIDDPAPLHEVAERAVRAGSGDKTVPLVFNGDPVANPGWIVAVIADGFYACTGTLLHAEWVLTAAHCVDDPSVEIGLQIGSDYWFLGHERSAAQVNVHPDYEIGVLASVDLAMIKLDVPVPTPALPVLASSPRWPTVDQNLLVVGWGETYTNSPVPEILQAGGVWVDSDYLGTPYPTVCPPSWIEASSVPGVGYDDFCFGGFSWACAGDSGGPLVGYSSPGADSGAANTVYGVTSYGESAGCSDHVLDTIAQGVGPHRTWISNFYVRPFGDANDEMFFYRDDGLFRFYNVKPNGDLGSPILAGSGYTSGWSSITAVDLDGDYLKP